MFGQEIEEGIDAMDEMEKSKAKHNSINVVIYQSTRLVPVKRAQLLSSSHVRTLTKPRGQSY